MSLIERLQSIARWLGAGEFTEQGLVVSQAATQLEAMQAEIDRLREAGIWAALASVASEGQRQAFIDGYNRGAAPPHSSPRMLEYHRRGQEASALFNPAQASLDRQGK